VEVIAMAAAIWVWTVEVVPVRDGAATLPDLKGYDVVARDGEVSQANVGKVEEVVNDDGRTYLVVDTGFWIFDKKRMIPAGVVTAIDNENRRVQVSLTKDEIKRAPDYDAKRRNEADVRKSHEDHYGLVGQSSRPA
jgi:PRC-barrel domain protein